MSENLNTVPENEDLSLRNETSFITNPEAQEIVEEATSTLSEEIAEVVAEPVTATAVEQIEETVESVAILETEEATEVAPKKSHAKKAAIVENETIEEVAPATEAEVTPVAEESHAVLEELEAEEAPAIDYGNYGKAEFISLLESQLEAIKSNDVKAADFKRTDEALKEARVLFDQSKKADRSEALAKYVEANGSDEGFEFKNDAITQRFEALYRQIKDIKNHFFQDLEKSKEKNLNAKTQLLSRLRELIDDEENNKTTANASWQEFTKIQNEWKEAGNIASPHNATLWAAYHALLDRYYSNRTIYNDLKELDRKRNLSAKIELIKKVEVIANTIEEGQEATRETIETVAAIFEEYKEVGPTHKAEQEALWKRLRAAMDVIYNKRREQSEGQKQILVQNYEAKSKIYEALVPHTTFQSSSINEWTAKTKEVVALQEEWVNNKGQMPRDEGRELSKKFWATLKVFFGNKGDFFKQLEQKRDQNLVQKTQLCEQAEAILEANENTAAYTEKIIDLQKQWKQIGQVPEKVKDSIFERFKKACDGYFERKRAKNQEAEKEFLDNLAVKEMLCGNIEAAAQSGTGSIEALNEFKSQWAQIGFVPKKDKEAIGKRYITAVNAYISAVGGISTKEKDHAKLRNEVEAAGNDSEGSKNLQKREGDIRRKISYVENEIAQLRNNIEFFARSKNTEKLRADVDKKIAIAEKQLNELKQQIKIIREA